MKVEFKINNNEILAKKLPMKFGYESFNIIVDIKKSLLYIISIGTVYTKFGPFKIEILDFESNEDYISFNIPIKKLELLLNNNTIYYDDGVLKTKGENGLCVKTIAINANVSELLDINHNIAMSDSYDADIYLPLKKHSRLSEIFNSIKKLSNTIPVVSIDEGALTLMVSSTLIYKEDNNDIKAKHSFFLNTFLVTSLSNLSSMFDSVTLKNFVDNNGQSKIIITTSEIDGAEIVIYSEYDMQDIYTDEEVVPSIEEINALIPSKDCDEYTSIEIKSGELLEKKAGLEEVSLILYGGLNEYLFGKDKNNNYYFKVQDSVVGDSEILIPLTTSSKENVQSDEIVWSKFSISLPTPLIELLSKDKDDKMCIEYSDSLTDGIYTAVSLHNEVNDNNTLCIISKNFLNS